jgi:hypothetical protein
MCAHPAAKCDILFRVCSRIITLQHAASQLVYFSALNVPVMHLVVIVVLSR